MIKFRLLTNQDFKGRCTEMLVNRMQCYSGADFELSDSSNDPTFEKRQVCRFHANLLNEAQKLQAAIVVNPVDKNTEPTKTEPKNEPEPSKATQKDTVNVIAKPTVKPN